MYSKRHILTSMLNINNYKPLELGIGTIIVRYDIVFLTNSQHLREKRIEISDGLSVTDRECIDSHFNFIPKGQYVYSNKGDLVLEEENLPRLVPVMSTHYTFLTYVKAYIKRTIGINIRFIFSPRTSILYALLVDDNIDLIKLEDTLLNGINDFIKDKYTNDNLIITTNAWEFKNSYNALNELTIEIHDKNDDKIHHKKLIVYNPMIKMIKGGELNV